MVNLVDDEYYYSVARYNIRKYRLERGLTQEELAELSDISYDYFREIENEKRNKHFSLAILTRIVMALDISMMQLFDDNEFLNKKSS